MPDDPSKTKDEPDADVPQKLGQTVLEDLHKADFRRTIRREVEEVYQFYLEQGARDELAEMDKVSRWLHLTGWLIKSSVLRLTPVRRLMFIASIFLYLWGIMGNFLGLSLGFLAVMLILLLELKDKLMAQDELMTGRAVQIALMPRENPSLPGWETWLFTRPANEVGGDLVDYLMLTENRLGLALGDVAGKGLGAALVMAKLQSTLRAIASRYESLADMGTEVNTIFRRDGLPDRFISLIYLVLEPAAAQVRLLNAGHMPPLVVHAEGIDELPKGAPALGLMKNAPYTEQYAELQPGDLMLLYSDGLTEARDEQGEFFGHQRLLDLLPSLRGLSAEAVGRRLLEEVEGFAADAPPSDDLSLIVVRRLPMQARLPAPSEPVEASDEA